MNERPGISVPERRDPTMHRIAVVNRGDAAVRFCQAVREYNLEHVTALRTIVLYTEPDEHSSFVWLADEAYCLGPAMYHDPGTGRRAHTYVDLVRLRAALVALDIDTVWVGWGFVSELPEFGDLCADLGIGLIGPSPATMRLLGSKIDAKRVAETVGVPVVPWGGPVEDRAEAEALVERIGYPLLIKASAGGGGRGIRRLDAGDSLDEMLTAAAEEARAAFGDASVLIERVVGNALHIEVQVAADEHGTVWAIGVRDCSVQRRRQKVIEEASSAELDPGLVERVKEYSRRLIGAAGYVGVGTVEFLYDLERDEVYFMEVNARLQVEHTVTELTTGLDLVKLQIEIAAGARLDGEPPTERGVAIEARITAEEPDDGFRPAPGRIVRMRLPTGPGLRVDTGFVEGDMIPPDFDPLIAKVLSSGRTRDEAIARLRRAMHELEIIVENGSSTVGFVSHLLSRPEYLERRVHIGWVDDLVVSGAPLQDDHAAIALVAAAVDFADLDRHADVVRLRSTAARGRPELSGPIPIEVELVLGGVTHRFLVERRGPEEHVVTTPAGPVTVTLRAVDEVRRIGRVGHRPVALSLVRTTGGVQVEIGGTTYSCRSEQAGIIRAGSAAVVVAVLAQEGARVAAGDVVAVLESMKLETSLRSPIDGVVRSVSVTPNSQVDIGAAIMQIELDHDTDATSVSAPMVDFASTVDGAGAASADDIARATTRLRGFVGPAPSSSAAATIVVDERALEVLDLFASCVNATSPARRPGERIGTALPSAREILFQFLRSPERSRSTVPEPILAELESVLRTYGATDGLADGPELDEALYRLLCAQQSLVVVEPLVVAILTRLLTAPGSDVHPSEHALSFLADATAGAHPAVSDSARAVADHLYVLPRLADLAGTEAQAARHDIDALEAGAVDALDRLVLNMVAVEPIVWASGIHERDPRTTLGLLARRLYRDGLVELRDVERADHGARAAVIGRDRSGTTVLALLGAPTAPIGVDGLPGPGAVVEIVIPPGDAVPSPVVAETLARQLDAQRVTITDWNDAGGDGDGGPSVSTVWRAVPSQSSALVPQLHPAVAERLELWRFREFGVNLLDSSQHHHLLRLTAIEHPGDVRYAVVGEVSVGQQCAVHEDDHERIERALLQAFAMVRSQIVAVDDRKNPGYNRVVLYARGEWAIPNEVVSNLLRRFAAVTRSLGLERIIIRTLTHRDGAVEDRVLHVTAPATVGMSMGFTAPSPLPVRPLTPRRQRVQRLHVRGLHDPFELVDLLTAKDAEYSDFPPGRFQEFDLDAATGALRPVDREPGENSAGLVVGIIENYTDKHPAGMRRVALLSDPSHGLGALAEAECSRIIAALDLAERERLPVEWFAVSSGARISMTSGTENLDWVARALRRIIEFTQARGEVNVVVCGVNVGAQPYFNAESTMLMHTRGILVMTPQSSMVLTGKDALDFAGGVSAEDNVGLGGYDRVMGPNGQAQYWAPTIEAACETLFRYYEHAYVAPGERGPRRRTTADPLDRDVTSSPHPAAPWTDFRSIGDVFSDDRNPDRKKPFDIRAVMDAVRDQDGAVLERWGGMHGAEGAVVWDAHVGGWPVVLLGVESHPLSRVGIVPSDGPDTWSAATLFPLSSKKIARAINSASGNRPVVMLANLAGFDGSPESLRKLQLEYGAEIGRAITNFRGPIVFSVISRYHGGAFVVFSKSLNERMTVLAVEGSKASVIGGSAAAAVVFAREVTERVERDPALLGHREAWRQADDEERLALDARRDELVDQVRARVRGEVAREFDDVHTVERALSVGSVDRIIGPARLRPEIVEAIAAGMSNADVDVEIAYSASCSGPHPGPGRVQ